MREDTDTATDVSPEEIEPKKFDDLPNAPDGITIVQDRANDITAEEFFGEDFS